MSKGIIRKGDKLTSGGEVISASSTIKVEGIVVSRIGDLVSCPKQGHGINRIVGSTPQWALTVVNWHLISTTASVVVRSLAVLLILYFQAKDRR